MSLPLVEKYRPKTKTDLIGNEVAINGLILFLKRWTPRKAPMASLLLGPAGSGKTSSVYAIAKDLGYTIMEVNASDSRNKQSIKDILEPATRFSELESEIRKAAKSQEEAHKLVEEAVTTAQESHDLMIELSEEVDRLRAKANSSQEGVIRSKREADLLHNKYVVSLRSIHSIQDLFKAMNAQEKDTDDDDSSKLEVTDLMSRLMSGDTLSTEELMALQRN